MKVICKSKVIDLNKFETVRYRESLLGSSEGYPVEAVRHEVHGGLFSGTSTVTEEIARFVHVEGAECLVKAITKDWIAQKKSFDVLEWQKKMIKTPGDKC